MFISCFIYLNRKKIQAVSLSKLKMIVSELMKNFDSLE